MGRCSSSCSSQLNRPIWSYASSMQFEGRSPNPILWWLLTTGIVCRTFARYISSTQTMSSRIFGDNENIRVIMWYLVIWFPHMNVRSWVLRNGSHWFLVVLADCASVDPPSRSSHADRRNCRSVNSVLILCQARAMLTEEFLIR